MPSLLPRGLPYHPESPAPCWGATWSVEDGWTVVVKCGHGHVASLLDHQIDLSGVVSPSLVCPEPGCGWHETVQLVGWEQGA